MEHNNTNKKPKENLSPLGIAIAKFKKAALSFDKNLSSGIEYDMLKVIQADQNRRAKFDLKMNLLTGINEFQQQHKSLFNDYAKLTGEFSDVEYPFDTILNNPSSAYNKVTELLNLLSKTNL